MTSTIIFTLSGSWRNGQEPFSFLVHLPGSKYCTPNICLENVDFIFTKLIEEHAVLFASVLVFQDYVNASVLCIGDGLPVISVILQYLNLILGPG